MTEILEALKVWFQQEVSTEYEPEWATQSGFNPVLKLVRTPHRRPPLREWLRVIMINQWVAHPGRIVVNALICDQMYGNNYEMCNPACFERIYDDLRRIVECHNTNTEWSSP